MATVTIGNGSKDSDFALDSNIAARARALREGRPLPELADHNKGVLTAEQANRDEAMALRKLRRERKEKAQGIAIQRGIHDRPAPCLPPVRRIDVDLPGVMTSGAVTVQSTTGKDDFVSRPDAREMTAADIANVQMLTRQDARELLSRIRAIAPGIVDSTIRRINNEWGQWLEDNERIVLSAMAVRKLVQQPILK